MTTTNKIGITQIILGAATLDETLNLCEEAGYEAVELTFRDGKDLHPNMTDSELADAARRCADAGVEIASVISASPKGGGGNLLSTDPDQREHGILRVQRFMRNRGGSRRRRDAAPPRRPPPRRNLRRRLERALRQPQGARAHRGEAAMRRRR